MALKKITDLTELTTPAGGDLLEIVDDPAGTPVSKKITVTNLLSLAGSGFPQVNSPLSLDSGTTRYGCLPGVVFNTDAVASPTIATTAFRYMPIWVSSDLEIDALQMNVWTNATSAKARLSLYNADEYWIPTSLVQDAGEIDAATTGVKTASFTPITLTAGRYHIAVQGNGTSFTPLTLLATLVGGWGFGQNAQLFAQQLNSGTTTYGAAPSTAYTTSLAVTTSSPPRFYYQAWLRPT